MNELRRLQYVEALGIDSYISRHQLPGAAATRRLGIRPQAGSSPDIPVAAARPPVAPKDIPELSLPDPAPTARGFQRAPRPATSESRSIESGAVRFSLAVLFAGQVAWIEELDDSPLAREQVQLVHAMATALAPRSAPPEVIRFDWPLHSNPQLGLDAEAARAGVGGFLERQMEQRQCRGLVLLGERVRQRLPAALVDAGTCVVTRETRAMLQSPGLKREVWQDLQPLRR